MLNASTNITDTIKGLKNQMEKEKQQISRIIIGTLMWIDRNTKAFAPVDRGYLKGSYHPRINPDRMGGSVYSQLKYAPYQEFGTGKKVRIPSDAHMFGITKEYFQSIRGKGLRKVNLRPQPHLLPAARLGVDKMFKELEAIGIKKA